MAMAPLVRPATVLTLVGALLTLPLGEGAEAAWKRPPPELPCDDSHKDLWAQLKEVVAAQVSKLEGRLPLMAYTTDLEAISTVQRLMMELKVTQAELIFTSTEPEAARTTWSECQLALLGVRPYVTMMQIAVRAPDMPLAAADIAEAVIRAPWVELLLSGWPVFTSLAILRWWLSPGMDPNVIKAAGTHASAASQAADRLPPSICDQLDVAAAVRARPLLGKLWGHKDAWVPLTAPASEDAAVLEEALGTVGPSKSRGSVFGGAAGRCRWTQHDGYYLGGLIEDMPTEEVRDEGPEGGVIAAMALCNQSPNCAGVTADLQGLTLRRGEPLLAPSPSGELSFVRWCTEPQEQSGGSSSSSTPPCPFARVTGLLATVLRRLHGPAGLAAFAPELVLEAEESLAQWASQLGQQETALESWITEWPVWTLLGKIQARLDLLRSPAFATSEPAQGIDPQDPGPSPGVPAWISRLQRALGFNDQAWRLATSDLHRMAASALGDGEEGKPLPSVLRESVQCMTERQCSAELFARLHLLLNSAGRLPLRDPIFLTVDDALSKESMLRSRVLVDGEDEDLQRIVEEEKARLETVPEPEDFLESAKRLIPVAHPLQVDRLQLAYFILTVQRDMFPVDGFPPMERCLEWDQPFLLIRGFMGMCRYLDIFSYSEPSPDEPRMGMPGRHEYPHGTRHYWGDLERDDGGGIEPDTFDLIICPFVFEHIALPFKAMKALARMLAPGGHVIWSAPMFQMYHGSPHDYYRYTPKGAAALARSAGLEVVRIYAPGSLALANGVLMGMMLPYWHPNQMLSEQEPLPKEDSPRYPLNVFALFRKPKL